MSSYEQKYNQMINNQEYIIIELEKSCGWSCFIRVYKIASIEYLYKTVSLSFGNDKNNFNLYVNNDVSLDITNNMTVIEMINTYKLKPIYPYPNKLVYKLLYINDKL